jgi:hypothetical protein
MFTVLTTNFPARPAMSDIADIEPREQRRESWPAHARRHGVSVRTLDRWVAQGILEPPERIRGRKYANPESQPRRDAA